MPVPDDGHHRLPPEAGSSTTDRGGRRRRTGGPADDHPSRRRRQPRLRRLSREQLLPYPLALDERCQNSGVAVSGAGRCSRSHRGRGAAVSVGRPTGSIGRCRNNGSRGRCRNAPGKVGIQAAEHEAVQLLLLLFLLGLSSGLGLGPSLSSSLDLSLHLGLHLCLGGGTLLGDGEVPFHGLELGGLPGQGDGGLGPNMSLDGLLLGPLGEAGGAHHGLARLLLRTRRGRLKRGLTGLADGLAEGRLRWWGAAHHLGGNFDGWYGSGRLDHLGLLQESIGHVDLGLHRRLVAAASRHRRRGGGRLLGGDGDGGGRRRAHVYICIVGLGRRSSDSTSSASTSTIGLLGNDGIAEDGKGLGVLGTVPVGQIVGIETKRSAVAAAVAAVGTASDAAAVVSSSSTIGIAGIFVIA